MTDSSVDRHKQAGHVAEALAVYEATEHPFRVETGRIFHRNVARLGKAQDAADRWLTDPDNPEQYDLGPRAEEVTVLYEETDFSGPKPRVVRKRAKLHVLLGEVQERHGIRVTGFETKFSDPRRLLTDYSAGLRSELIMYLDALATLEEKRQRDLAEQREHEQEQLNVAAMFEARLGGVLVDILTEQFVAVRGADEAQARELAEAIGAGTLAAIVEAFQGEG